MEFTIKTETINFNRHIKDFKKRSNLSTEVILKKFAFDLLYKIIKKMPVDTGRARAGWYTAFEWLDGRGESVPYSTTPKGLKASAVAMGRSEGSIIHKLKGEKKYIELINGVNYLIWLEYGWSQQAPFGMIRLSMREMRKGELPQKMTMKLKKDWNKFYG